MKTIHRPPFRTLLVALCLWALQATTTSLAEDTTNAPPPSDRAARKEKRMTPGGRWRPHDPNRPHPAVVSPPTPSTLAQAGRPPSDAIVLFDGTDLSHWQRVAKGQSRGESGSSTPAWTVGDGYMEIVPKSGWLYSREKFGDCQIHIEWATPAEVKGDGQGRGNSGIFIDGHTEIQVLDSWHNDTYADGQAGALYGLYPPLVNATRPPGEWQSYDIIYIAPRLENGKILKPALYTVFLNGVLLHHAAEVPGDAVKCAIGLQDHHNPVRYRNIWVRELKSYDE